ncbi:hypothetical protein ACE6H2_023756 [Prunus campanulata]
MEDGTHRQTAVTGTLSPVTPTASPPSNSSPADSLVKSLPKLATCHILKPLCFTSNPISLAQFNPPLPSLRASRSCASAGLTSQALSLTFSALKNLTFLELSYNNLTGSIPNSLSQFSNLDTLHLDRNKLTALLACPIPKSFGEFHGSVLALYLSHNQLSGKIPTSLAKLDFSTIDFSRNKLEGDASMLFGLNKTTQKVDLSRNLLEFDLSKVKFSKSLSSLDLNHNKITGSIPVELTQGDLQYLNVSYNRLCGQIPVGGKLQSFDSSTYFHNRCLCGTPLPSCK